jgi:hypothetical protein
MLGMTKVPCLVLDYLTDAQAKALAIADNKIPLNSGWDLDLLKIEIEELQETGMDLGLLAFNEGELATIMRAPDDLEPIAPTSEESGGCDISYLVIGKNRVPLEVDEMNGLQECIDGYVQETGSFFGFGGYLLRKIDAE